MPAADNKASGRESARSRVSGRTVQIARPDTNRAPITLEVIDGPMDGAVLTGAYDRVGLGRGPDNDLPLFADRSVSSRHAFLVWHPESQAWMLEDRGSTNGTWLEGARLATATPIPPDTLFLAGNAVIRFGQDPAEESWLPSAEALRGGAEIAVARLSPAAAQGWGAAISIALAERRGFMTARQLFLGLAATNPQLAPFAPGRKIITARQIGAVRSKLSALEPDSWPERHLRKTPLDAELTFASELLITPRVARMLALAAARAETAGRPSIGPADLLVAVLMAETSIVRPALASAEAALEVAIDLLGEEGGTTGEAVPAASPAPSRPMVVSSGDAGIDDRARETARALFERAALFHLATPEERRTTLRELVAVEVARCAAPERARFIEQLARLFPVVASAMPQLERPPAAPQQRRPEIDKRPAVAGPEATSPPPWRLVVAPDAGSLSALAVADRDGVRFLGELLEFAGAIERFIVGMVTSLTARGRVTDVLLLPGWKTSLGRYTEHLRDGRTIEVDEMHEYLAAVQAWLVAATAAFHEGPELWFREHWRKVNPSAIEAGLAEAGRKKVFRIEAVELWESYKERVRNLTPELAADEILVAVRKRAEEQYARLQKRSSKE